MSKLKNKQEMTTYRRYHSPGASNLNSVKLNCIFINKNEKKGYTKEHEQMKFELAWEARGMGDNFLTEAARWASDDEKEIFKIKKDKVVDFVNLSQDQEYEIINKHENDFQIKFYRGIGVIPMIVGETIICEKCKGKYPKRNKGNVCQVCRGEE